MMIGAVDEHHVVITERLRGRQASEPASDDDDLFVRHERELEIGYVPERKVSTFWRTDAAHRDTGTGRYLKTLEPEPYVPAID
jgi:hypothetical protein